jgi:hypothetical protein
MAKCPGHGDRSASLSVREMDDGRILLHCFAGCDTAEVVAAVGVEIRDLFPLSRLAADGARRSPPYLSEMVKALQLDLARVMIASAQLARSEPLSDEIRTRLGESVQRISRGLDACRPSR